MAATPETARRAAASWPTNSPTSYSNGPLPIPAASPAATAAAEAQATRLTESALAGVHIADQPMPAVGPLLDKAAPKELEAESDLLALLTTSVGASDTVAQKRRVDRLGAIIAAIPFWQAESLAARLAKPVPGDRLAAAFTYRLSTETRQVLLGRLRARAATKEQIYSKEQDPRKDPKYIDNVLEEVRCWLIYADRYTLVFPGGRKVVVNADIDWKKNFQGATSDRRGGRGPARRGHGKSCGHEVAGRRCRRAL